MMVGQSHPRSRFLLALTFAAGSAVALSGCTSSKSPFAQESERDLRRAVLNSTQRELEDSARFPKPVIINRDDVGIDLVIKPEILPELQAMAGINSYKGIMPELGRDLNNRPVRTANVSLERLTRSAVENNVAVQFARLGPAISQAQVIAAEAAFDWTLFSNVNWTNQDSPRAGTSFGGAFTPGFDKFESLSNTTGLRRVMVGGGRMTVQQDTSYTDNQTPGQQNNPNPAQLTSFTMQWDQPLLRGAGSEVTQAEIRIARNAERAAVQTLRRDIIRVVTDLEKTYWDLVQSYADVLILQRLQERGEKTRDQLRTRARLDTNQAQIADAVSRVERRKLDVLNAQARVRQLSDRLKALANDPSLPVGSEVVVLPSDRPIDAPIQFNLVDSLRQAIQNRPEVQQSVIAIDDASIRQMVARNQRLPDLNVRLQSRWSSLDDNVFESYGSQFNGSFIDYVLGGSLEFPIGNRRAEAELRRRRLERMQTVLAYKNSVQTAVSETKTALVEVNTRYKTIAQASDARLAASEVLRVLLLETQLGEGISVERLDLELNRQESLAQAERAEVQAFVQYNSGLADLFAAMGTTLERNKIEMVVPTAADVQWEGYGR
jgi:outer membrane protein TolC